MLINNNIPRGLLFQGREMKPELKEIIKRLKRKEPELEALTKRKKAKKPKLIREVK